MHHSSSKLVILGYCFSFSSLKSLYLLKFNVFFPTTSRFLYIAMIILHTLYMIYITIISTTSTNLVLVSDLSANKELIFTKQMSGLR